MKKLKLVENQCTGCESCVLTCSFEHGDTFGLHLSRIRVNRKEETALFTPRACVQCEERFCIQVCPTEALFVNPATGAIQVLEENCVGCGDCEKACPFGGVHFTEGIETPFICDLCGGDPQCVNACQLPRAIIFVEEKGARNDVCPTTL